MECTDVSKFIYVYLDGEFEPRECAAFEEHVRGCPRCRQVVNFEQSFHRLLRDRLEHEQAPAALRARITAQLDAEDAADRGLVARILDAPLAWKLAPAAMAAAFAAVLLWPMVTPGPDSGREGTPTAITAPQVATADGEKNVDALLSESVAFHKDALPVDISGDGDAVGQFVATKASFRAAPPFRNTGDTRLVGARLARVGNRPAVLYTYEIKGRRMTVVQMREADEGTRRASPFQRALYTTKRGGYNVAVFRDSERGLTHSLVGDVEERDLMGLIPAAYQK